MFLLSYLLRRINRVGRLTVIDPAGKVHVFEGARGPAVTIRIHDGASVLRMALNPRLHVGEAYMNGTLTVEDAELYDFLNLAALNSPQLNRSFLVRGLDMLHMLSRRVQQHNPIDLSRKHAAHHYDLSGRLYDLFLDNDRQYSCAYFTTDNDSLEVAQDNKKRHIAAKLLIQPGVRVLDIGSGWGGLGIYLARIGAGEVIGVTLSQEQLKRATDRAAEAGLAGCVKFVLRDYREQTGVFDRIVSVGMFEHVGVGHYGQFFAKLKELLAEDGVALIHSIGRSDGPAATNPWVNKYIFPGGYSPALSEVVPLVERAGLCITDIEILRLHYADTLKEWRRRFMAHRDEIKALYDERFCRMWEFYLAGSEIAFRHEGHMVWQMQVARRQDAVPLTRDYITDWERSDAGTANLAV